MKCECVKMCEHFRLLVDECGWILLSTNTLLHINVIVHRNSCIFNTFDIFYSEHRTWPVNCRRTYFHSYFVRILSYSFQLSTVLIHLYLSFTYFLSLSFSLAFSSFRQEKISDEITKFFHSIS